nr:hypothetical protein [Tanacetum cinerariifolium]
SLLGQGRQPHGASARQPVHAQAPRAVCSAARRVRYVQPSRRQPHFSPDGGSPHGRRAHAGHRQHAGQPRYQRPRPRYAAGLHRPQNSAYLRQAAGQCPAAVGHRSGFHPEARSQVYDPRAPDAGRRRRHLGRFRQWGVQLLHLPRRLAARRTARTGASWPHARASPPGRYPQRRTVYGRGQPHRHHHRGQRR